MELRAQKLKESQVPGRTALYEVRNSRAIVVEEKQDDSSLDHVILEYCVGDDKVGYFAKEYRPFDVSKERAKVIDITAVIMNHAEKSVRWHLYDIKDTLAGENTIVKLYNQWDSGLQYLQQYILCHVSTYKDIPDLGVITRCYDEDRMERLRDKYQSLCDEIENGHQTLTLAQRKKRPDIAKIKGTLKAVKGILDRKFQPQSGDDTYEIHIRYLSTDENGQIYQMRFLV